MCKTTTSVEGGKTLGSGVVFVSMLLAIFMVNSIPSSLLVVLLTFSCWFTALAALGSFIETHSLAAKSSSKLINGTSAVESRPESQRTLVAKTPTSTANGSPVPGPASPTNIPEPDHLALPIQPAVVDAIADDADVDSVDIMAAADEVSSVKPTAAHRAASPHDVVDSINGGYGVPDDVEEDEEEIQRQALETLDEWDQEVVEKMNEVDKGLLAELLVFVSAAPPATLFSQEQIGSGASAGVHRVIEPNTGVVCAAKVIRQERGILGESEEPVDLWLRMAAHGRWCFAMEAGLLARLHHPNIVRFLGSGQEDIPGALKFPHKWMLLELAQGCLQWGDLVERKAALGCLRDLASALKYMQQQGILHNDMKPGNVLVFDAGDTNVKAVPGLSSTRKVYKLADFGLANAPAAVNQAASFCGTWEYAAPEVVGGNVFSFQSDLYSLYVTWMEGRGLITDGDLPNNILREGRAVYRQREVAEAMRQEAMFEGVPFWEMIRLDPSSRPSAADVVVMVDTVLEADVESEAASLRRRHPSKIPVGVRT